MSDTTYQIFQDGQAYKVRITRVGHFIQEADGFSSYRDAASWVAQAERFGAVRAEQQKPISSPYLRRVVCRIGGMKACRVVPMMTENGECFSIAVAAEDGAPERWLPVTFGSRSEAEAAIVRLEQPIFSPS
jgi:hypothetical protein